MQRLSFHLTLLILSQLFLTAAVAVEPAQMEHQLIDAQGPVAVWGKGVGDINGDGLPDLLAGGHRPAKRSLIERMLVKIGVKDQSERQGELVWYKNPDWQRMLISDEFKIRTDIEVGDVNGDGVADVVAVTNSGLVVFYGPDWRPQIIDARKWHDVELADLDRDGALDLVVRNQSLFGYNNGDQVIIFRQDSDVAAVIAEDGGNVDTGWQTFALAVPRGEGLKLSDIDGDGFIDIVVNKAWFQNPGAAGFTQSWQSVEYTGSWFWQDVFIATADMDADGDMDIVLSPSEEAGQRYRLSWFESRQNGEQWREHVVDSEVEAVLHFVGAADFNLDGAMDIVSAEMNQSQDPDNVTLYLNQGDGRGWSKQILSEQGSHSMRIVDIDGDLDPDLYGANWQFADKEASYPVSLWRNQSSHSARWRRHVIDAQRPGQALFVRSADLDADGWQDVVTGAYWYRNHGDSHRSWQRNALGAPVGNALLVEDFDDDGDSDILASTWRGYSQPQRPFHQRVTNRVRKLLQSGRDKRANPPDQFVLLDNHGQGEFERVNNPGSGQGDFLQGVALFEDGRPADKKRSVLLSWHKPGFGLQALTLPEKPMQQPWTWARLSNVSQDEQVSTADIDGDGDTDVMLGTIWLQNDGQGQWRPRMLYATREEPDRHQLVDMNGDGRLDVVVGYQAISRPGKLAWYEQGENPAEQWQEHLIANMIGPMSVGVADVDGDGDYDVIAGEHNLQNPSTARLLHFENIDGRGGQWRAWLVHRGDEHHNGAHLVDIDNDSDLDIVSIGLGHNRVLWYENIIGEQRQRIRH